MIMIPKNGIWEIDKDFASSYWEDDGFESPSIIPSYYINNIIIRNVALQKMNVAR